MKTANLSQDIIDRMNPRDRESLGLKTTEEALAASERKDEPVIQRAVENYLIQRGYARRSPEDIKRAKPRRGWFLHFPQTKRNPIVCDLIILANDGRYLELELKTLTGPFTVEQAALIGYGSAAGARGAEEAVAVITEWEEMGKGEV